MAAGDSTINSDHSKVNGAIVLTGTFEADNSARDLTLGTYIKSFSFVNEDDAVATKADVNSSNGVVAITNADSGVDTLAWRAEVIL